MRTSGTRPVYVDSSAIVKLILPESESGPLIAFLADHPRLSSSSIAYFEVLRAVRRQSPHRDLRARNLLARIDLIGVNAQISERASTLGPPVVRTLDAIHLATSLMIQSDLDAFASYDARMQTAATSLGLPVLEPS